MKRTLNILSAITLSLGFFLFAVLTYWYFYPYNPIKFNQPFKILTPKVVAGDDLQVLIDYCKYTTEIATVDRHFVDGIIYNVPPITAASKATGCQKVVFQINVPHSLPPGSYYIQTTYIYHPNPIRTIDIVTTTEKFEVISATIKP